MLMRAGQTLTNAKSGGRVTVAAGTGGQASATFETDTKYSKQQHLYYKLYVGSGTDTDSSGADASLTLSGGMKVGERLYVGSTTASTSASSGSAVFAGGIGVADKLFVGSSTDTDNGGSAASVTISGGLK